MPRLKTELELLPLLRKYINEVKKGKQLQKNGKRVKKSSIKNYEFLELLLTRFSISRNKTIRIKILRTQRKTIFDEEKKYWKDFYFEFTSYLYDDLKHHDNYVGRMIKLLRTFFNYLIVEKGLNIGNFHKNFYAPSEEVGIVVITPERLNYLIHNQEIEKTLTKNLKKIKDIFVFGCTVALRYSDIMLLSKANVEVTNFKMFIKTQSQKTQTYTRVKLPEFSEKIIHKYSKLYVHKLLPQFSKAYFNRKIKVVMEKYGFTEPIIKTRQRRGIPVVLFKNNKTKQHYRFCDAVTSHTMRRSAITTMLSLGMNEQTVRQISGHAANSKEFFRYVSFAQTFIDTEIDSVHEKLTKIKPENT
ncbi:MAG: tyrosine-type recombinase/integrase [Bacteroidota bacterium]|jgi:hypothetical protein|nr:tyrosine-type recombinase/integrase [Bacteroidota bacterium]MCA6444648.1 tyrosine-type recombinase/integrase [Bacteroidota bacterium]